MAHKFQKAQLEMINSQIRPNKVTDPRLLEGFAQVPRHEFVPQEKACLAYTDSTLLLKEGLYLLQPMVLARLLQLAAITKTDKILDLAPATGYSSALLVHLAHEVVAVFSSVFPVPQAADLPESLRRPNFFPVSGDPQEGYSPRGPYDVILIAGAVEKVPSLLFDQLTPNGRLVTIIQGRNEDYGQGTLFFKNQGSLSSQVFFETSAPLLPFFNQENHFVF
jgi:protein-L-isoaspartate(D-aspartate) O-methyltransferase